MSNFVIICYNYLCQPFGGSVFGERRNPSYNIQGWFYAKKPKVKKQQVTEDASVAPFLIK